MAAERILSEEQVARFHRDGYLLVRGMYAPDEVAEMIATLARLRKRMDAARD